MATKLREGHELDNTRSSAYMCNAMEIGTSKHQVCRPTCKWSRP